MLPMKGFCDYGDNEREWEGEGDGERERERERGEGKRERERERIKFMLMFENCMSPSSQKEQLASNVLAMVRTSNELAMMIPSEILEETTTHGRAKVICSYIKVSMPPLHSLAYYGVCPVSR